MTNPQTLLDLADEVERSEPSQELNAEVFAAVFPYKVPSPIVESGYGWRFTGRTWWCETGEDERIPRQEIIPPQFTTSLDAAMTLVPEGCDWSVGHGYARAFAQVGVGDDRITARQSFASTPAAALTAASLRAMETYNEQ